MAGVQHFEQGIFRFETDQCHTECDAEDHDCRDDGLGLLKP
ncbi:MAG: hypothetical protein OSB70_17300 [Myxococcota bacterium]|nr:hypothetical protein [Myxococcota bacterium]